MKKFKQGLSNLALVISVAVIVCVLGGLYLYKSSTTKNTNIVSDSQALDVNTTSSNEAVKTSTGVNANTVSQNSGSNLCGNFTAPDAKEILGDFKYSSSLIEGDGSGYRCKYTNGGWPTLVITVVTKNPLVFFSAFYPDNTAASGSATQSSKVITGIGDKAFSRILNNSMILEVLKGNTVFYVSYSSNMSLEANLGIEKKIAEKFISKL